MKVQVLTNVTVQVSSLCVGKTIVSREPHNALRRDLHCYVGKDLWIRMILVLFAYCIAGGVHGEKIRKSAVRSLMEQPTQFSATPLSVHGSYGDEYQGCSSRVLQLANSAEILPRVASDREQEAASENTSSSDYCMVRNCTLIVASFPGPTQLSVAISTVKRERAWYLFSRE